MVRIHLCPLPRKKREGAASRTAHTSFQNEEDTRKRAGRLGVRREASAPRRLRRGLRAGTGEAFAPASCLARASPGRCRAYACHRTPRCLLRSSHTFPRVPLFLKVGVTQRPLGRPGVSRNGIIPPCRNASVCSVARPKVSPVADAPSRVEHATGTVQRHG